MNNNKSFKSKIKLNIIKAYLYVSFGLMTELVVTAIGGNSVGFKDYHYLTMMANVSLWMILVYLIAFPLINKFNDSKFANKLPMIFQTLIGGVMIITIELISGIILNLWLGLNCWSYVNENIHLLGQICLRNSILFTLAYPFSVWLIDITEWLLYREREELNYSLISIYKRIFILKDK